MKKYKRMRCCNFSDVQDKAQFYDDLVRLHSPKIHDFAFILALGQELCISYWDTCALLGAETT